MAHLGSLISGNPWATNGDLDLKPVLIFREL